MTHPNSLNNLRPWPKGVSGYAGRKKLPDGLRDILSLTNLEANKLISKWARFTKADLDIHLKDPKTSLLELSIGRIFQESIRCGDFAKLAFLLDRAIGKTPVAIDDDETADARDDLAKLSMGELLTFVRENLPEQL